MQQTRGKSDRGHSTAVRFFLTFSFLINIGYMCSLALEILFPSKGLQKL